MFGHKFSVAAFWALALLGIILIGHTWFGLYGYKPSWCLEGETPTLCTREWLSAFSGWAAAIVAGASIIAIIGQLDQQRKQTAYLLGEAEPSIDIERLAPLSLSIRVVNWNRRKLTFRFDVSNESEKIELRSMKKKTETEPSFRDASFLYPTLLPGWEDKQQRPSFAELQIELEDPIDDNLVDVELRIETKCEFSGRSLAKISQSHAIPPWGNKE
ncbi:hypothetical protein [Limoniibacter endophyticus]|uniref:Uncharacterized protein n=1 Tax=Limoniibacter endophyticus TaxID=1565040 RepID=A0A8J3GIM6_9HYPH|nr:hypothetical protein [Limoniibacter endophyticus]GHC79512.1 hypothetical protein GCM10010136_32120 [Limoniibacter endophyticus]